MPADASGGSSVMDVPSTLPEAPETPFAVPSDDAESIEARDDAGMHLLASDLSTYMTGKLW